MKTYNPRSLKPNPDDLFKFAGDKISETGKQSAAWKVTLSLFQTTQRFYRALGDMTSERLSTFVENQTYLNALQEHDLVAITAIYVTQLDVNVAREIVTTDQTIADTEREILLAAIDLFQSATTSTHAALGNPKWIE